MSERWVYVYVDTLPECEALQTEESRASLLLRDLRKMEWFVQDEAKSHRSATHFCLQMRQRGDEWDWVIYDLRYEASIASGTAPAIEVAESAAEEITGHKPQWHSRM